MISCTVGNILSLSLSSVINCDVLLLLFSFISWLFREEFCMLSTSPFFSRFGNFVLVLECVRSITQLPTHFS
jgi:hypothetical protein